MAAEWSPGPAEIMGEEEFTNFRDECLNDAEWTSVVSNEKCQVFTKKVEIVFKFLSLDLL